MVDAPALVLENETQVAVVALGIDFGARVCGGNGTDAQSRSKGDPVVHRLDESPGIDSQTHEFARDFGGPEALAVRRRLGELGQGVGVAVVENGYG